MLYQYEIYHPGSREDILLYLEREEPLPHLVVGHRLLLASPDYIQKFDVLLEIEEIEILIQSLGTEKLHGWKTMIYLREKARTTQR